MIKNNLLTKIEELMRSHHFHCEWGIDWTAENYYFTITLQYQLPNPGNLQFTDCYDQQMDQRTLPYELEVVFYNNLYAKVLPNQALVTIEVDHYRGIPLGELVCIVKYLKTLSTAVPLHWSDYLDRPDQESFLIEWDWQEYEHYRRALQETWRYNDLPLFFPDYK